VITSELHEASASDTRRSTVLASGLIEASPAQTWSVITDHSAYPSFMPSVEATRVVQRADGRLSVLQHLRILFVDVRFSTLWTLDPARGLATWQLDESAPHDIAETSGSWQLAPLPERDGTLVRYRARVDTGRPLPGAIERLLTRSSLPRVVRSVREEVQRRYGP
jgi:ribosome-associated toxin RatA of RatAB toxin-antitoxin module